MREDKFNLCQILFNNKTSPEKTAIIYNYDNISYRELKNKICQYGTFFMKMHIRPNDTVAIYIEDSPESIYCFWGSILIGAHPVILNKKLEWSEVARICAGINVNVLIIDTDDNFTLPYTISIRNIKDALGESNYTMHLTAADKEIFTIFTSGSTGTPKRIEHSYADVVHCIESYGKKVLGITENDIFYSQSKLAFVFGLVSTLFLPFAVGATAILNHKDDIQEIGKISCQYRPTLFFAVPIIYKMLLKMEKTNSDNFSSVRAFVSSGETLPSSIIDMWACRYNKMIIQGYGSTETLYIVISNDINNVKRGSSGKLLDGYQAKICDFNGNEVVSANKVGELYLSGGSIAKFSQNANEAQEASKAIWWKTGDLFKVDDEGFYWYVGRIKDNFKINGAWLDAYKISNVIEENIKILESVVSGEISNNDTTKIVAYIVAKQKIEEEDIKNIRFTIIKKLGRQYVPQKFYLVENIPKGITGKVNRSKLNEIKIEKVY